MIKLIAKRVSDGVRCKATARGKMSKVDLAQEAISAICSICELAQKADSRLTPEGLLEWSREQLENKEHSGGLTVRCYKPEDECEHYEEGGWCGRFARSCAEVHDAQAMEDGEE